MSLLLSQLSRLCLRKPALVRRSCFYLLIISNGFSSSLLQTAPGFVVRANPCGEGLGKLLFLKDTESWFTHLEKKVPLELVDRDEMGSVGSCNGWVATLKDDRVLRLQDDLNPTASHTHPKHIPLPPLVTLPHCQTQIITNVSMSSSSPEDEDCVVAVKFLGPQLSFCRPAQSQPEWINVKIEDPCFFSSRVMFSKKDGKFRIPGSGGSLIGSWDLNKPKNNPKIQRLQYQNLPKLTKIKRELLDVCCTSEHLVESITTGETFLVKWFRKTSRRLALMKTKALMVFKIDEEGNAVYTQDIGDLVIYISKSEPFCVPASSFPGLVRNSVRIVDVDEDGTIRLHDSSIASINIRFGAPYFIPPQNIDQV
ncbi:hypothetical protein Rs2_40584 [Raphanus sativus]|uniref:Uncharacterized protein LOC108838058 n=1 Tax=Raphanus sativus TaxID=3726 RepID=A0A6J0M380_RAPSA|nr:uncharacterized protein LOC108838058 [Raphanus sativus]KAJ4875566.1 hypothetical protein Rs2_40584 [Raphanus sativus]